MRRHVFLLGMPGCGKSSLAAFLGKETGVPVVDTDHEIEKLAGSSVSEIWNSIGENGFRALERSILFRTINGPSSLVSTGGGLPCFFDNMALMSEFDTVFLDLSEEVLLDRNQNRDLPLLREAENKMEAIRVLRSRRLFWYQAAPYIFDPELGQEQFLNFFKSHFLD